MSWIFGITGNISDNDKSRLSSICADKLGEIKTNNTIVLYGGIPQNVYQNNDGEKKYLAVGIPLKSDLNKFSRLKNIECNDLLLDDRENFDGHYVIVKISDQEIKIVNDFLGLKDCFITRKERLTIFSTRLDFICQFTKTNDINFEQFSTSWLCQNQISTNSVIKNIKRLGPGGKAVITKEKISHENINWIPNLERKSSKEAVLETLSTAVSIWKDGHLSLGISGGLDSRFIFSLLKNNNLDFNTHTFGNIQNPDCSVANQICLGESVSHNILNQYPSDADAILKTINKYIGLSGVIAPATEFLQYDFYRQIADKNYLLIDGGFGEVFRRQFLNRAAIKGKPDIINRNIENLIPHFLYLKADIFNHDITDKFQIGVKTQLDELFDLLPNPDKIGIENWLDLAVIKTRLPNLYGGGQNSLDSVSRASMPFALKNILQAAFNLSLEERKNGKFFKQNISKSLHKYPLVKSGTTYPFGLSTISSWGWTKLKNKFGSRYFDNRIITHLHILKEFIHDIVISEDVKTYEPYNYTKIVSLVNKFYKGENNLSTQLDWWLSFELWRRSLNGK